jgi:hypothetical protein
MHFLKSWLIHTHHAGEGRVHDCLRSNRDHLSDACRKEELLLEELVGSWLPRRYVASTLYLYCRYVRYLMYFDKEELLLEELVGSCVFL